jgi:hypothetical protein
MTVKPESNGMIWKALVSVLLAVNIVLVTVGANWVRGAIDAQGTKIETLNTKITELLVKSAELQKDVTNQDSRLTAVEKKR